MTLTKKQILALSIESLELSKRVENILLGLGIFTIGQLVQRTLVGSCKD